MKKRIFYLSLLLILFLAFQKPSYAMGELSLIMLGEDDALSTYRISGKNRIETSVKVSQNFFESAETVVIANANEFPDALSSSVLAKVLEAPILLTNTSSLDAQIVSEIKRLGIKDIVIVGGKAAVSEKVEKELRKYDPDGVERIAGKDRFETSAKIAEKISTITRNKNRGVLASGLSFADALSIAPFAAREEIPILLSRKDSLPESIDEVIQKLDIKDIIIAGGNAAIFNSIENKLPHVSERIAGEDRYETSFLIAQKKFNHAKSIFMSNGNAWADALVIGGVAGRDGEPILLSPKDVLHPSIEYLVDVEGVRYIFAIGGEAVLSKNLLYTFVSSGTEKYNYAWKDGVYSANTFREYLGEREPNGSPNIYAIRLYNDQLHVSGSMNYNIVDPGYYQESDILLDNENYVFEIDDNTKYYYFHRDWIEYQDVYDFVDTMNAETIWPVITIMVEDGIVKYIRTNS